MNLVDCYRVLELTSEASFHEVKASYRRLARQYHPDVSSGDQRAKDKFIEATTAYKVLLNALTEAEGQHPQGASGSSRSVVYPPHPSQSAPPPAARRATQIQTNPSLSPLEHQLKVSSYQQLQQLLKAQRFPRAIALVEGLARRLPGDTEVVQWQAIVYQQWGRQLIRERQFSKARLYLKKALQTDPHNRSLWAEVEKDFRCIEQNI